MITLSSISKRIGGRTLFDDVSITFTKGNRYSITGPNGAGKSTLLKIIMGTEESSTGTVSLPKRTGFLRQNIEAFGDLIVRDVVIMGNRRLWDAMSERDRLYEGEIGDKEGMRLGELEEVIIEEDGYSAESNAEILLQGMGLPNTHYGKLLKEIPTGDQFKVLLCQALFGEPDALLLDEPTNHLDLESISWLETFLKNYEGILIVVSHDRHFLNTVTTHTADIDYETIILYPGNYDFMVVAKSEAREQEANEAKTKGKKAEQLEEFIRRFSKGTRASQVQSRMRELERLRPEEQKRTNIQRPYITFADMLRPSGRLIYKLKGVSKAFDHPVLKNFSIEIERGDKIGVIGNNGMGKSTLLKILAGVLNPDSGTRELGHEVSLGYFPQNHHDVVDKSSGLTVFDWVKSQLPGCVDQDVRGILGKMLFTKDEVNKTVEKLSGGETGRMIIAGMMLCKHNTHILDEPNNHFDLEAVSALGVAISDFPGTAIFATHDRDLLDKAATKIIYFDANGCHFYPGPYAEFLASKQ